MQVRPASLLPISNERLNAGVGDGVRWIFATRRPAKCPNQILLPPSRLVAPPPIDSTPERRPTTTRHRRRWRHGPPIYHGRASAHRLPTPLEPSNIPPPHPPFSLYPSSSSSLCQSSSVLLPVNMRPASPSRGPGSVISGNSIIASKIPAPPALYNEAEEKFHPAPAVLPIARFNGTHPAALFTPSPFLPAAVVFASSQGTARRDGRSIRPIKR